MSLHIVYLNKTGRMESFLFNSLRLSNQIKCTIIPAFIPVKEIWHIIYAQQDSCHKMTITSLNIFWNFFGKMTK